MVVPPARPFPQLVCSAGLRPASRASETLALPGRCETLLFCGRTRFPPCRHSAPSTRIYHAVAEGRGGKSKRSKKRLGEKGCPFSPDGIHHALHPKNRCHNRAVHRHPAPPRAGAAATPVFGIPQADLLRYWNQSWSTPGLPTMGLEISGVPSFMNPLMINVGDAVFLVPGQPTRSETPGAP